MLASRIRIRNYLVLAVLFGAVGAYMLAHVTPAMAQECNNRTKKYCINGTSDGVGFSWGVIANEALVCSDKELSVPNGQGPEAFVAAFVASINLKGNLLGVSAKVDPNDPKCFIITYTEGDFAFWVGDAAGTTGQEVGRAPVSFNPTISEVEMIPTVTQWGMVILIVLLVAAGILVVRRQMMPA